MANWNGKRVTILGLGRSGLATALYLAKRGAMVTVSDSSSTIEADHQAKLAAAGVDFELGGHKDQTLAAANLIVTSPGIKPSSEVISKAKQLGKEIISDIELAFRELSSADEDQVQSPTQDQSTSRIIAITGTNGKSTTCALVSYMLTQSGKKAPACGNIGVPILSVIEDGQPDWLVVEVSSFQLAYCTRFQPEIAVWLNLTPDHLDWHGNLAEYIKAKSWLFENMRAGDYAVLNVHDDTVVNVQTNAHMFPFSTGFELGDCVEGAFIRDQFLCLRYQGQTNIICHKDELRILGEHNLENALAAISVCAIAGLSVKQISQYLTQFEALEHRLEFVGEIDGVRFYNDSKATNTDSTIKALQSFPDQKVVLIAGGRDKGTDLNEFAGVVNNHAEDVVLIGEAAQRFAQALSANNFANIHFAQTMEDAIEIAFALRHGPVLLSPACASFDMFRDYEDRGRVFKDIVRTRQAKLAPSH